MPSTYGANENALQRSLTDPQPINPDVAAGLLKEVKEIFDRLEVVYFLRQGTCLGAIRDGTFISWDDDVDIASVLGLHGLTDKSISQVGAAFTERGYFVTVESNDFYTYVAMMKSSIRLDWTCHRIIDNCIYHYPGIRIPVRLVTGLKEIDFIGEKFLVPNPPEEYLCLKYGAEWMTPMKIGYEKDILQLVRQTPVHGRAGKLKQFLVTTTLPWRASRLRVLDHASRPVAGAEVEVAGLNRSRTNSQGYARFYLPCDDFYALVVKHGNHEELLYQEKLAPGATYTYRPDPKSTSGRVAVLSQE